MKVGLLVLEPIHQAPERKSSFFDGFSYTGFRRIIKDVEKRYKTEYCHISNIGKYDFVLLSLISNRDVQSLVYAFEKYAPKKKNCKLVIGGAGVINIKLFSEYIDIACFGRGENQTIDIIEGKDFPNVWRKETDPTSQKVYIFRQVQEIVEHEAPTVGCLHKCAFCSYTYTHKAFGYDKLNLAHYSSAKDRLPPASVEDDWKHLDIKDGRTYTSAWDGFSEETRLVVNKMIKDRDIVNKIEDLYKKEIKANMWVKVFSIVGYPWGTIETLKEDIRNTVELVKSADHKVKKMKLRLVLMVTPFMAEPMTPMQYQPVDISTNYRSLARDVYPKGIVYRGRNIDITMVSYITSPLGLLKRMYVNRGTEKDLANFKKIVFTKKLKSYRAEQAIILLKNAGLIPDYIVKKINKSQSPFQYLKTYVDVDMLAEKFDNKLKNLSEKYEKNCS